MNVLYVEDEALLGRIVKESLESRGCTIDWYTSGRAATAALEQVLAYDIAVLDVQLPGRDGFAIASELRERSADLPILFLTARTEARDAVAGFAAGGNDYIRKPFSMEELLVRMENLIQLRKGARQAISTGKPSGDNYRIGALTFDYRALTLASAGGVETLSHREAELLRFLWLNRRREVIERREILLALWGDDGFFNSRNLDVYVRKLRRLLEADPGIQLLTLRGVGYRMIAGE